MTDNPGQQEASNDAESFDSLESAAVAWVEVKGRMRELSAQQTRERKRLKRIEPSLLSLMRAEGRDSVQVNGSTITCTRNLKEE